MLKTVFQVVKDVAGSWVEGRPALGFQAQSWKLRGQKGQRLKTAFELGLRAMSDKGDSAANCGRTTGPRGLRLPA